MGLRPDPYDRDPPALGRRSLLAVLAQRSQNSGSKTFGAHVFVYSGHIIVAYPKKHKRLRVGFPRPALGGALAPIRADNRLAIGKELYGRALRRSGGNVAPLVALYVRIDPTRKRNSTAYICPIVQRGAWVQKYG